MPKKPNRAELHLETTVPPGSSLVGVTPLTMFRVDLIDTIRDQAGLSVFVGGRLVPCDGRTHPVEASDRTLCIGCFLAVHVRNERKEPADLNLGLVGWCLEGEKLVPHFVTPGSFTEKVTEKTYDWQEGSEMDCSPEFLAAAKKAGLLGED